MGVNLGVEDRDLQVPGLPLHGTRAVRTAAVMPLIRRMPVMSAFTDLVTAGNTGQWRAIAIFTAPVASALTSSDPSVFDNS